LEAELAGLAAGSSWQTVENFLAQGLVARFDVSIDLSEKEGLLYRASVQPAGANP
jgi:hypothetical protein